MQRVPTMAYPIIVPGRPDLGGRRGKAEFGVTRAKKHPKYVHGKIGMARLLHKIDYVEMHWYTPGGQGQYLVRLATPRMFAQTVCGTGFSISGTKAKTCEMPNPKTVLCGKCHGTGTIWGRGKTPTVTPQQARDSLGCSVAGIATSSYLYKG